MNTTKTVFISYSWDSEDHKNWVLTLADRLIYIGIEVIIDRYGLLPGKSMTLFMEESVDKAHKVLLILTPEFKKRADDRKGGAGYEYAMVTQELYSKQDSGKFIPILRTGNHEESAPKFIKGLVILDMREDSEFEKQFNILRKSIFDQSEISRPDLGKLTAYSDQIIDVHENLKRRNLPSYSKWTIKIILTSLNSESKANLFKLIVKNALVDKKDRFLLPFIINNTFKVSHNPEIIFEIPLKPYFASNHLIQEKLKIDTAVIHYEFAEYSDWEPLIIHLNAPFLTLIYLLVDIKKIHQELSKNIDLTLTVTYEANKNGLFHGDSSPFKTDQFLFNYEIPDNKATQTVHLTTIDNESLFNLFEKLYSFFESTNSKSVNPYLSIDRKQFELIMSEFWET